MKIEEILTSQKEKEVPLLFSNVYPVNYIICPKTIEGDIGLELEIEGTRLITTGSLDGIEGSKSKAVWFSKEDGSLRGGREYVLSTACYLEEVPDLLGGFFDVVKKSSMTIRNSNRCSTHVHLNFQDMTTNQITSFIVLWTCFENSLVRWWGEERVSNHFCLTGKDSQSTLTKWYDFLTNGFVPSNRGLKYYSLNILTLWKFGSLEIRCGGGLNSPEKGILWTTFLQALKLYCLNNYENPVEISYAISEKGPTEILRDICNSFEGGDQFYTDLLTQPFDIDTEALDNFREVQNLVFDFDWAAIIEEIKKPKPEAVKIKKKDKVLNTFNEIETAEPTINPFLEDREARRAREIQTINRFLRNRRTIEVTPFTHDEQGDF